MDNRGVAVLDPQLSAAIEAAVLADARGDLGKKQEAIDSLVRPLAASLAQYEQHVRTLEATRVQAYTSIEEHLKSLAA
ncbi:MAG: hypothetical protein NTW28_09200, partial [Candidatus Solibacter sp.]|nr:hypothetical protein [Candidatus Solibacter sp.]